MLNKIFVNFYHRNIPNRYPRRSDCIHYRFRSGQDAHNDADKFRNIQFNETVGLGNLVVKPIIFTVAVSFHSFYF